MDPLDEVFRDGLRDAVSNRPELAPVELDEVVARATRPEAVRRPLGRWIGLAAALTFAAGLGLWALQSSTRVPTEPVVAPTFGGQVQTLRVRNDTDVAYQDAALQLSDGRTVPVGDVPAGGSVLVPVDATPTSEPSVPVGASGADPGLRVLYSGDCASSAGQLVGLVGDADGMTIQIVASSEPGSPAPVATSEAVPACTITISQDEPTPEATPR